MFEIKKKTEKHEMIRPMYEYTFKNIYKQNIFNIVRSFPIKSQ